MDFREFEILIQDPEKWELIQDVDLQQDKMCIHFENGLSITHTHINYNEVEKLGFTLFHFSETFLL